MHFSISYLHIFALLIAMEDDGLLLNFLTEPVVAKATTKVKGGRWRDRRKLQLSLQGREQKPTTLVNSIEVGPDTLKHRAKRKAPAESFGPTSKQIKFSETKGEFGGKNNSYVSSLFTSNSTSTLKEEKVTEQAHTPSNAPMSDSSTFPGLGLNDRLTKHLTETLRFKAPTKVQKAVIPSLMATEHDLFVKAQTGSGKTLSFLLPIMHKLMSEKTKITRESGLFAIILTPTRELATQIYGVMETVARCCHHIVPGIVIGGEKKKSEKARIRKGVNILVATPGRLADHMENTESFDVGELRWLILDEGDRLVELGFEETITKITTTISQQSRIMELTQWPGLPNKRVNVLCSATMQSDVKKLGSAVLNKPKMISVEGVPGTTTFEDIDETTTAPDQLIQKVVVIPPKLRLVTLASILKNITKVHTSSRTIVFFSCSDSVEFHFNAFTRGGSRFKKVKTDGKIEIVQADKSADGDDDEPGDEGPNMLTAPVVGNNTIIYKLHGSLLQQARTATITNFVNANVNAEHHAVLFCTDVASRGLDLPTISNVVEFDPPFSVEDHLHRIGRSARLGQMGVATMFLLPGIEEGYVEKIRPLHPKEGSLQIVNYEKILAGGFAEDSSKGKDSKLKIGKWDIHATTWHLEVERWLLEDQGAHDKATQGFTSHIRAYATHLSSERAFFNVKLLHLGHLAKSFGLRETPKKLGKTIGTNLSDEPKNKRAKEDPRKKMLRMAKMAVKATTDEFNY